MPTPKERMLAGEPYLSDDPELLDDRVRCRRLTWRLNALAPDDQPARDEIVTRLLGSIGAGAEVLSPFHCDYGYQITIGERTFVNFGAVILDSAAVDIGRDVQIGPGVQLVTPVHPLDRERRATNLEWAAPIVIGDGAWLATGVIVCAGVTVGRGAVVGAGSVVIRDLPARHLCVGNPCRVVREV
jgi:maltose O-acetyltransferase